MGGIEAMRRIQGNFQLYHQPTIIAVTGQALTGVKKRAAKAGWLPCSPKRCYSTILFASRQLSPWKLPEIPMGL
jgi:CheY-like chemotaxis protein